jgi:hypothetical protein
MDPKHTAPGLPRTIFSYSTSPRFPTPIISYEKSRDYI